MTEPTYTLNDAKKELARQECAQYGHDYQVTSAKPLGSAGSPVGIHCDRCLEHWSIASK